MLSGMPWQDARGHLNPGTDAMDFHRPTVLALAVAAITLPSLSFANSVWHPANGEAGFTYHPEHFKSAKSRADVLADLEAARKDGSLWFLQRGMPVSVRNAGPSKTREQVIGEMRNESAEVRRARMEMQIGG